MSRKRNHGFLEAAQSAECPAGLLEGPARCEDTESNLLEGEDDEELLCSVSQITEHLGRNITVLLETALSDIRRIVSVRIRVLKTELREKSEEVEALKARLDCADRDNSNISREYIEGTVYPPVQASLHHWKHSSEQKKVKAGAPVVKKENINAICDYLMKDKNSRGSGSNAEVEGEQLSQAAAPELERSLWTDSGVSAGGPTEPGSNTGAEDIFNMLPSASNTKRLYDYEWMAGVELNTADFKGESESKCENVTIAREAEEQEESEEGRGGLGMVSDTPSGSFPLDTQASSGEDRSSPVEDSMDRLDAGQHFSTHTFICPFCGTLCPDSMFLEEHLKLMHRNERAQAMHSTSSVPCGEGLESEAGQAAGGSEAPAVRVPRERKVEGGYECGDCGRHFNYLGNLRQHQRIHTGEKPFVCPECGERFRHAARLKSHRLSHSGAQSPFPCPQCGKGFPVLSGLKRHQRVHTGESPYACPQCGRRFKELGNLYTHMRIHSGATPYSCYQCGRSFRHLGTYKSHRCTPATQLPSGHSPAWAQEDKVQTG